MEERIIEIVKKEQNKMIKKFILILIVACILTGTIGVAAGSYNARQVNFTPSDNTWKVKNVSDAIDDLKFKKVSNNYSTEEQVIGTWIDGRPVYQRVITGFNVVAPGRNWGTLYSNSSLANCELKNITGYGSTTVKIPVNARINNNTLQVWGFEDDTYTSVIIQYTKTTDSATN